MRTAPAGGPPLSSLIPSPITRRDTPVARATVLAPPRPIASASLAASSRRVRSSRCRASISNRRVIASTSTMPHSLAQPAALCYVYSLTDPLPITCQPTSDVRTHRPGPGSQPLIVVSCESRRHCLADALSFRQDHQPKHVADMVAPGYLAGRRQVLRV